MFIPFGVHASTLVKCTAYFLNINENYNRSIKKVVFFFPEK